MADTICAERGSTRGMERERRHLVRNVVFFLTSYVQLSLSQRCTPTLSYYHISLWKKDHDDRHPYWKARDCL
jgi:hypothetical protein